MKNKKNILTLCLLFIITIVIGIFSVKEIGIKDGGTFTLSVASVFLTLILMRYDFKKAVYLYIISMPILVTARKVLYLDLFFIKLNFESIVILALFIFNFKEIYENLKVRYKENSRIFKLIGLFVLFSLISVIFARNFGDTLGFTVTSVIVPILLGIIILTTFEKKDLKYIAYALGFSVNLSCLYGMVQLLGIGFDLETIKNSRDALSFGYHNGNIFVNIALMVFPLLMNYLLYEKTSRKEKVFLILSLGLQALSIFLTFSRGAWLGLAICVFLILISKKYKYICISLVIIGLVASPFVLPKILGRGDSSAHFLENTSNTARILAAMTSKDIMKNNLFGVGYGNFNSYYRANAANSYLGFDEGLRVNVITPLYTMEHAHNFFLNIGVEGGIISLILMVLIFANRIKETIKSYSINRGIFVSIMLFLFIGLTTGIVLNHKGVVTNTYIMWILFAMINLKSEEKNKKKTKIKI